MLDLLLTNAVIITVDAEHHLYDPGYLGIEGDTIACLGPMEGAQLPPARRTIDMGGNPVLPGLIDGHGHAGHCMTKTLAEHLGGDDWRRWWRAFTICTVTGASGMWRESWPRRSG